MVANPYTVIEGGVSSSGSALQHRSSMEVESHRVIAEVQAAVLLAKKFPRSPQRSMDRILNECQRVSLAEKALYSYARGGTDITGPSIRLAEVIARNWENIDFGIKELSQNNGQSEMMAYAWDLETNVRQVKVFTVKHIRHTKKGAYDLDDPRDIYEAAANNGARRLRACILGIIPGDVVEAAVNQSEETLKAKADTSPEAIKKMVEAFTPYGINKEMIEKRIQRRMDAITPAQIISLRKIYVSLKDEMSSPADWFEMDLQGPEAGSPGPSTGTEALKQALKRNGNQTPKSDPTPPPAPDQTAPSSPQTAAPPDGPDSSENEPPAAPAWDPETAEYQERYPQDKIDTMKRWLLDHQVSLIGLKTGRMMHEKIRPPQNEAVPNQNIIDALEEINQIYVDGDKDIRNFACAACNLTRTISGYQRPDAKTAVKWLGFYKKRLSDMIELKKQAAKKEATKHQLAEDPGPQEPPQGGEGEALPWSDDEQEKF